MSTDLANRKRLRQGWDRLFDDFFVSPFAGFEHPSELAVSHHMSPLTHGSLRCDLVERPEAFDLKADVPGFSKDQIDVSIDGNILTIHAANTEDKETKSDDPDHKVHRMERWSSSLSRRVKLPETANPDAVKASCVDGVLTLTFPKREAPPAARRIAIE